MKILEKLLGKRKEAVKPEPVELKIEPAPYDYGLGILNIALRSEDFGWKNPDSAHKKVILVNPQDCKEKISVLGLVSCWRGTGHSEWEFLWAGWFVDAVLKALENNAEEADITCIFDKDYIASDGRCFTQYQVYDHLIKWFDIVEDDGDTQKLKLHI